MIERWTAPGRKIAVVAVIAMLAAPTWAAKGKKKKGAAKDVAILAGEVRGTDETPLPGAGVQLSDSAGEVIFEGRADGEALFEVSVPSPSGSYRLRLTHEGYAPFETDLELTVGEQANLVIKLLDQTTAGAQQARAAFNEGASLYEQGDTASAKARFEEARSLDPSLPQPNLALTDIYLGEGALDAAREAIDRYLEAMPDDLRGVRLGYQVYRQGGDKERSRAMLALLRGTEYALPLAQTVYNEGVAAMRDGDTATAIEQFEVSASMEAGLAEPLVGLATIHYNATQYEDVRRALERLEAVDAANPTGLRLRYLLHDALAETDAAAAAFEAYRAVAPREAAGLLYERAELDFKGGDAAGAKDALLRILVADPDHARAHYTVGLAFASLGDNAKAREHLQRFIELAPEDPETASAREMLPHLQ